MIRDVIGRLSLHAAKALIVRSLVEHIVAGVATDIEKRAFKEFCATLDQTS